MSVSLTTYRGRPALEIADHKGECWLYYWTVLPGRPWRVRLGRIDPATGLVDAVHTVTEGTPWQCSCPDYVYRRKRITGIDCKHSREGRELKALLAVLQGVSAS